MGMSSEEDDSGQQERSEEGSKSEAPKDADANKNQ